MCTWQTTKQKAVMTVIRTVFILIILSNLARSGVITPQPRCPCVEDPHYADQLGPDGQWSWYLAQCYCLAASQLVLSITHRGRAVPAAQPAAGTADLLGPLPHDQLDRDEGVDADGQDQGQEDVDGCRGSARFFLRLMINLEDLTITRKTLLESFHFMSTYQVRAI